jgi:hypothetical protein
MRFLNVGWTSVALSLLLMSPVTADVVINEVFPNPGSAFDGAEFIELYNTSTTTTVDIGGWVVGGPEFEGGTAIAGLCADDLWAVPAGTMISPQSYIVFAKDNIDTVPGDENDGFLQRFGFDPDFEFFDTLWSSNHDSDDPNVDNMQLISTNSTFDDQMGLWPGVGYAATCSGTFNRYEALFLWDADPRTTGVLVDAIEWRDPIDCTGDICLGVGTSDDDAYDTFVNVGESVGRDASSSDTGNSRNDLASGTPTPGAPNIANAGPLLSNLLVDNASPKAGQTSSITITATDSEGIGTGYVVYSVNGGAADSVSMSSTGVDQYTGTIGPFTSGDIITYFVRVYDGGNGAGVGVSKFPDFGDRSLRWGTQSIFAVQFHTPPRDTGNGSWSSELGNPVNIEGIVTTEPGLYNAGTFVVQSGTGFWTGVHCHDQLEETTVQRGDSVRVAGVVEEFFGLTEVSFFGSNSVTVLSSGNPIPGPDVLTASSLPLISAAPSLSEPWEGVHVRIDNVEVTNPDDGFGQWDITDVTGTAKVGDDAFYLYGPTLGDSLTSVSGVVGFSFSERKLEPRDDADIVGPPIVGSIAYSPTPPLAAPSPLKITAEITDFNGSIATANLLYSTNNGASYDTLAMTNPSGNSWEGDLSSVVGPEIDYHIEVEDNDGFTARGPSIGDFDLYRGLVSIETIQSTTTGTSDSSSFAGSPVNCAGIVTMEPGTLADNIFVIQNNYVTDPANKAIQVFTGGSVLGMVSLGDSVAVSGDVVEFFGLTQMDTHFTTSFTNYGGGFGQPLAFELDTSALPPDSTGILPASEPFESVLVQFTNAIVTNSSAGFGQYFIDNTAPKTGEETLVDDDAEIGSIGELNYEPTLNDNITVRGIVDFAFGQYKVQPRNDYDIMAADPTDVNVGPAANLAFALHQSVPNPFTGSATRIGFALPRTTDVTLHVFDVTGRLVETLVNGPVEAGAHVVDWNGRNDQGHSVANGVYFYRLQAAGESATRKMTLIR